MSYEHLPKTRAEAKAAGASYYFTGVPCKHGHIAPRKTKGACLECLREEWRNASPKRAAYLAQYNASEAGKASKRRYYERNREHVIAAANSRPREQQNAYKQKYKLANPDLYRELLNYRRRRMKDASPPWLTADDKRAIREVYRAAAELTRLTGTSYVVDHVVPLIGEEVCGLHVPWNLRPLTRSANAKKYNGVPEPKDYLAFPHALQRRDPHLPSR